MADDERDDVPLVEPEHLEHLALFPLPGAVFFPGTMLPLHVFEPRYRQMTAEAIEDGTPIAVMNIKEPPQLDDQGRPQFHEIGGAGFV
ncbi:MAG: LON peptidase substrate-binding domain-containing protein, partial [Myxococcota bacterium]